ncbi:opacity protein [Salegentibacter salinarum]|uniref:Opacity protein n=1 Tax=Salegentibacter salinarum TaxID=447422 RepID=A0A2N0TNC6_9FLAO|nr:porin family protein [Salegentibacter salinarum]PKD16237.1 opacity protein [Salegentibacter salinarum]SKB67643.1 Outer membrane protein beta-barrel domain-containing protein [Salegentibacter salinarum]
MKTLKACFIGIILLFSTVNLSAQEKWSAELRPGINFATSDLGDAELKTGYGAEVALGYRFMPHLGAYVGWGWNQFSSDNNSFAGTGDTDYEETGYTFGLQFIHPIAESATSYLIRIGGIYNHIEVENSTGDITADSDHGLGWEIGAGIQVDLGGDWNLRPQVGYRALSRDLDLGSVTTNVDLNYFTIGIGIAKLF